VPSEQVYQREKTIHSQLEVFIADCIASMHGYVAGVMQASIQKEALLWQRDRATLLSVLKKSL